MSACTLLLTLHLLSNHHLADGHIIYRNRTRHADMLWSLFEQEIVSDIGAGFASLLQNLIHALYALSLLIGGVAIYGTVVVDEARGTQVVSSQSVLVRKEMAERHSC